VGRGVPSPSDCRGIDVLPAGSGAKSRSKTDMGPSDLES